MKLVFNSVSKNYGLINALTDISFAVKPSDFLFIIGPSGAGKSTLIKLILAQTPASSGQVLLDGQPLSPKNKKLIEQSRKKIGVIFQDYQLVPDQSVEENIALALDIVSFPKDKIQSQIDRVLKQVGLENRRLLFPAQLSGGELQRTALARALAIQPELILADEPTGNLDYQNAENLVNLLKEINQKHKTAIIMATHNLNIVKSAGQRIIYLKQGKIEKDSHKNKT